MIIYLLKSLNTLLQQLASAIISNQFNINQKICLFYCAYGQQSCLFIMPMLICLCWTAYVIMPML